VTTHAFATAVIEFESAHAGRVDEYIASLGNPTKGAIEKRLNDTGSIHFASISVVDISDQRSVILIEVSADCDEDRALELLANAIPSANLKRICQAAEIDEPCDWGSWLRARKVRIGDGIFSHRGLCFDGTPSMSVDRIKRENDLVEWLEQRPQLIRGPASPQQKLAWIRAELWTNGGFKFAFAPQPCPILLPRPPLTGLLAARSLLSVLCGVLVWPWPVLPALTAVIALLPHKGGLICSFVEACGLFVLAAIVLLLALRHLEKTDPAPDAVPDRQLLEKVLARENLVNQNVLMTTSIMKPARLRRFYLWLAFVIVGRLTPLIFAPGQLGDISDIHFARWALLPGSKILVFRSNYDGSWLTYLSDFVQRAPEGVSMIWSNTAGFPRTSWLFADGAADGPRFLQWARTQTKPAPFWYAAYPMLSMSRIRLNTRIVRAVATGRLDQETVAWLISLGETTMGWG
jgi:hypothetical protein